MSTRNFLPSPELKSVCKCDDVNGDLSDIVKYNEWYYVTVQGPDVKTQLIGVYEDELYGPTYTPINPIDCNSIGTEGHTYHMRIILGDGQSWSPTVLTKCYTIRVEGDGAEYRDSEGNESPLIDGEILTYPDTNFNLDPLKRPSVVSSGATIYVTYTKLT